MDRHSAFRWAQALAVSAPLLVGCGERPHAVSRAVRSRVAQPSTARLVEPRRLDFDPPARSLDARQEKSAVAPNSHAATLTAGKSAPVGPPVVILGGPSPPRVSSQSGETDGPLLFQPTGADNAPPTANASPAPRISVANSRPMLVRDRPSNIDNRRPPNITRMQPQASAAEKAELALVNQKATQLIQQGFLLAERGATYSARSQFQEALWMVAEALDAQEGSDYHSRSLAAGLTAAREAGEFAVRQRRGEEGVDIAHVAAGHRTAILKEGRAKGVNALRAQQMYLSFAQEQLTIAASRQAAASQALYGMGRLAAVAANGGDGKLGDVGVAAVCFQAALVADGRNFRAANELGVLLANHGRLPAAVDAFERCLQVSPEPVAWRNLASAYAMLGKKELADRALAQANAVPATNNSPTNVQWLEPSRFADTVTQDSLSAPLAAKPQVTAPPAKGRPGVTARLPGPKSASSR